MTDRGGNQHLNNALEIIVMPASYSIGSHYEALVQELVKSGRYASASEDVRIACACLRNAKSSGLQR